MGADEVIYHIDSSFLMVFRDIHVRSMLLFVRDRYGPILEFRIQFYEKDEYKRALPTVSSSPVFYCNAIRADTLGTIYGGRL